MSVIVDVNLAKNKINRKMGNLEDAKKELQRIRGIVITDSANCQERENVIAKLDDAIKKVEELITCYEDDIQYIRGKEEILWQK